MGATEHIFTDIQGKFLVALKSGHYRAGVRSHSFPASSSLMAGMPPVYQQSMRGTCVASAATAMIEYYEDCKTRLSVQFLHEMTKNVEMAWIDGNLSALSKGESVDAEFGIRFSNQVAQIRLTSDVNGADSPASQALLNAFSRQIKKHFGIQSGSSIRHCFAAIKDYGVCRYSLWPYANIQTEEVVPCASLPPGSKEDANKHRILTGLYILRSPNNVDEIRGVLAGANNRRPMPVCVGLELYEGCDSEVFTLPDVYEADGSYVSASVMKGVHEMLIVGYEDDDKAPGGGWFTVRNSWGSDWGKAGYGRVPYAYIECFCVEAGTILQDMVDYRGDDYGGMSSSIVSSTDGKRKIGFVYGFLAILLFGAALVVAGLWHSGKNSENVIQSEKALVQPTPVEQETKLEYNGRETSEALISNALTEVAERKAEEEAVKRRAKEEAMDAERKAKEEAAKRKAMEEAIAAERKAKEEAIVAERKAKEEAAKRRAKEEAEAAAKEKELREAELKKLEADSFRSGKARLEQEKRIAEEKARLERARQEAENEKRLAEERRIAAERAREELEAKLEAERREKEEAELKKPVDYVFHMTINCKNEDEYKALLDAMERVSQETGFYISEMRSEGNVSMWGNSRFSVRCDMKISAPRNQRLNARKLLADYLAKECKTKESIDWTHSSRIMSIEDFANTINRGAKQKKTGAGVRFGP